MIAQYPGKVMGCQAELEVKLLDVYKKEDEHPEGIRMSFHFWCPCCHTENIIPVESVPLNARIPKKKTWLKRKEKALKEQLEEFNI